MRSYANLWPRITSFGNLYRAFCRARRGKRTRPDVAEFEYDLERNLLALQKELLEETYRPGRYRHFIVHEPAERKISAAPFRDRVGVIRGSEDEDEDEDDACVLVSEMVKVTRVLALTALDVCQREPAELAIASRRR